MALPQVATVPSERNKQKARADETSCACPELHTEAPKLQKRKRSLEGASFNLKHTWEFYRVIYSFPYTETHTWRCREAHMGREDVPVAEACGA